jgi:hypothetical protein
LKRLILLTIPLLLLASCAKTVPPEEFLTAYRLSGGFSSSGDWQARYTGKDDQYHYIEIRTRTVDRDPVNLILYGPFKDEIIRCPILQLPEDFPTGFWKATDEAQTESPDDTRDYVRRYLAGERE